MTDKEIKEKWFPICQPGNLVKRTDDDGEVSFFIVVSEPKYYVSIFPSKTGIELKGIWISQPISLFENDILRHDSNNIVQRIICLEDSKLELSNQTDLVNSFSEEYLKDIKNMYDEMKKTKEHIRIYKQTLRTLDDTMTERYKDAMRVFDENNKISETLF